MKRIFMNKEIGFLSLGLLLACMISLAFFVQSCSQEDNLSSPSEALDPYIATAPELEDYIEAGADFGKSMANFTTELKKINFSKLKVTYDSDGNEIIQLPATFGSMEIEKKIQMYNEKKEVLYKQLPQFASLRNEMKNKYFQQCIQQSVNVVNKFSELKINVRPLLKSDNEGDVFFSNWLYGSEDDVLYNSYLNTWMSSSNYVELYLVIYQDGKITAYQSATATSENSGNIHLDGNTDGPYYFPTGGDNSQVTGLGHTHIYNSSPTYPVDYTNIPSGLNRYIYYNGTLTKY